MTFELVYYISPKLHVIVHCNVHTYVVVYVSYLLGCVFIMLFGLSRCRSEIESRLGLGTFNE